MQAIEGHRRAGVSSAAPRNKVKEKMQMHERLALARKSRGYERANHAAEAMGVKYPTYAAHENGSRNISRANVARYAKFFGVSVPWLEHGIGDGPKPQDVIDGDFIVVGEDTSPAAKLPPPTMPKGRTLKEHLAEQRAASVSVERAIAVTEGAMLAANIKPERVAALRSMIQGCLEEPLDQTIPEAEFSARRAMAKIVLSQFLEQGAAQEDKE